MLRVTYIGHATLLIEVGGKVLLTDPNFDPALGKFLPRVSAPGIALEALPRLDAILVTHAHADHLSFDSLDALPADIPLFAPPVIARWLIKQGYKHAIAVAPGDSADVDGVRIHAASAMHRGNRYGVDRWRSAANMYLIDTNKTSCFFAGDTALTSDTTQLVEIISLPRPDSRPGASSHRVRTVVETGLSERASNQSGCPYSLRETQGSLLYSLSLGNIQPRYLDRFRCDRSAQGNTPESSTAPCREDSGARNDIRASDSGLVSTATGSVAQLGDTIVAVATPSGRGAIAVVRLSGPAAFAIAAKHLASMPPQPRVAHLSNIRHGDEILDQALVTLFPAPIHSPVRIRSSFRRMAVIWFRPRLLRRSSFGCQASSPRRVHSKSSAQ